MVARVDVIGELGLGPVVAGLIVKNKLTDTQISRKLQDMGHPITKKNVASFRNKIGPERLSQMMTECERQQQLTSEQMEQTATAIMKRMEERLIRTMEAGDFENAHIIVATFSQQMGAWFDRIAKMRQKNVMGDMNITTINITNQLNVFQSVVVDVLTGKDEWADAWSEIDKRMKERIGDKWDQANPILEGEGKKIATDGK
jgi:hypothetical protein